MKIRKVLLLLIVMLLFGAVGVEAEGKVKVYIFSAEGCPYCEQEIEYLEGLSGYGTKFEIIEKELYIDHVNWEKGSDFELGKTVAEAFNNAGFDDATYKGTPFVVISDLYASATYSTDLESIINESYQEGDKDAVKCIENGNSSCIRSKITGEIIEYKQDDSQDTNDNTSSDTKNEYIDSNDNTSTNTKNESKDSNDNTVLIVLIAVLSISLITNIFLVKKVVSKNINEF